MKNNILKRIIAFFKFRGEEQVVEVDSAEIREDIVFLHPTEDPEHTICIKTNNVGIMINHEDSVSDEDIFVVENDLSADKKKTSRSSVLPQIPILPANDPKLHQKKKNARNEHWSDKNHPSDGNGTGSQRVNQYLKSTNTAIIKKVSFEFYENEYNEFKKAYEEFSKSVSVKNGNRTEFILACTKAAKKTSMESLYKKYHNEHQRMLKEEREARKKAEEELSNSSDKEQKK